MTGDGTDSGRREIRVLITGGGTGGHVYPGLAVAESVRRLAPGADVRFAGTRRGLESVLVPRAGYRLYTLPASGFRGLDAKARMLFVLNFGLGVLRSLVLLLGWRPAVVLGTGGYVSAPVMAAARVLGVPCVLQEQNAVPGSANRLVGRWVQRVYLGFGSAARFFGTRRCFATGNPVRAAFLTKIDRTSTTSARDGELPQHVLVFGGSGGAQTLNRAVAEAAVTWSQRSDLYLLIQTGRRDLDTVQDAFGRPAAGVRVQILAYIDDMAAALRRADLVVCRAGAMTLAELQCTGRPAVLVPFPHATDDHQMSNARDCERAGAAVVLADADCDGPALTAQIDALLRDRGRLDSMAAAAADLARPQAADDIAGDLLELVGHPAGRSLTPIVEEKSDDVP